MITGPIPYGVASAVEARGGVHIEHILGALSRPGASVTADDLDGAHLVLAYKHDRLGGSPDARVGGVIAGSVVAVG